MKKQILLPALAWVGGIVVFFLRRWELNTAFDYQTHLMSTTVAGVLLSVLMAVLALAFCFGCRGMGKRAARDWFYDPSTGYAATALSGGLVMLIAGGIGLYQLYTIADYTVMSLVAFALLVVGGGMAAMTARDLYRGLWSDKLPIRLMGPSFATLVWLVCIYQEYARQPEVRLYAWQVLSAVAIVLALYGQASLSLEKGSGARTCVYGLLAIALTPAALADGVGLAFNLVWLGSALWLTAQSHLLLRAAFDPNRPERMCPEQEEEEETEQDNDLEDANNE